MFPTQAISGLFEESSLRAGHLIRREVRQPTLEQKEICVTWTWRAGTQRRLTTCSHRHLCVESFLSSSRTYQYSHCLFQKRRCYKRHSAIFTFYIQQICIPYFRRVEFFGIIFPTRKWKIECQGEF